jgi:protein-tyrosine phosphatase
LINILFICLGNICRSPIAEGVFKVLVKQRGLDHIIRCDSAGTGAYHLGSLPDKRMRKVASSRGITLTHQARQLSFEDFINFNYIMAMDTANFEAIRKESFRGHGFYLPEDQLYLYRMFDPERGKALMVPDPYYEELPAFTEVYNIVERSGKAFLDFLIEKHGLTKEESYQEIAPDNLLSGN